MPAYITLTLRNLISHPGYRHDSQLNAVDRAAEMTTDYFIDLFMPAYIALTLKTVGHNSFTSMVRTCQPT